MQTRNLKKYGWKRDLPDHRDLKYVVANDKAILPPAFDLRKMYQLPACYDQGNLGSCTANACGFCWQFGLKKEKLPVPTLPARLFIYYYERLIEGTVNEDSGAQIRDGFRVLNQYGCCNEKLCPYHIVDFRKAPSLQAINAAKKQTVTKYMSVAQKELDIKTCLANSLPCAFGFTVFESFKTNAVAQNGIVPMPNKNEQVLGGHAVCIIGYDDSTRRFIVRNSWGVGWGDAGYFYMPYDYVLNPSLASDFWCVQVVA